MKSLISLILLSVLFAAGSACAQAQTPQFPCEDDARFAEFDFWIGAWEVHTGDGGETWESWFEGFYTRKSAD
jgi:hypothetical protein